MTKSIFQIGRIFDSYLVVLKSIKRTATLILLSILFFQACKDFPEDKGKPYFVMKGDTTITQIKGYVLSGDTLEYLCSYASNSESNVITIGSLRLKTQPVEFEGPDSNFNAFSLHSVQGKILDKGLFKKGIPEGILPGQYSFYAFVKNPNGQKSDSGKFSYFINSRYYPVLALDTPLNGILENHRVNSQVFRIQMRGLGDRLSHLEWQWFDSLKVDTLAVKQKFSVTDPSNGGKVNKDISFPSRKGKKFYLRAVVSTLENRKILWWIPFERTI